MMTDAHWQKAKQARPRISTVFADATLTLSASNPEFAELAAHNLTSARALRADLADDEGPLWMIELACDQPTADAAHQWIAERNPKERNTVADFHILIPNASGTFDGFKYVAANFREETAASLFKLFFHGRGIE